jgi:hypothetical protein
LLRASKVSCRTDTASATMTRSRARVHRRAPADNRSECLLWAQTARHRGALIIWSARAPKRRLRDAPDASLSAPRLSEVGRSSARLLCIPDRHTLVARDRGNSSSDMRQLTPSRSLDTRVIASRRGVSVGRSSIGEMCATSFGSVAREVRTCPIARRPLAGREGDPGGQAH